MCISMPPEALLKKGFLWFFGHKFSALMFENKEITAAMFFAIKSIC